MTGVGSKSYWKVIWERIAGDGATAITNVEDMDAHKTEDIDEMGVYREINESFGVSVVRLIYKPENTVLIRYTLDKEQKKAYMFYDYYGNIIRYSIYMNDSDSSFGQKDLDLQLNRYEIQNNNQIITIEEYEVEDSELNRYIAEFKYRDVQYQLMGVMEKNEFEKIVKNLVFL